MTKEQWDRLDEKFGGFTEGLALPSMTEVLTQRFDINFISPRARSWRNGRCLELDVFAYSRASGKAFIVGVCSHLQKEGLDRLLKPLQEFREFFPEHADKKIYGILAVVDAPEDLRDKVLQDGIYLARIHDGQFELQVPDSFQPRAF